MDGFHYMLFTFHLICIKNIPSISCSQQGYGRPQDAFLRRTDAANRGNPFLVLDLSFKIVNGVRAFDLESDGLAGEGLKKIYQSSLKP